MEAKIAFNSILDNWLSIVQLHDPLVIKEKLIEQKEFCNFLINEKDHVIRVIRDEINRAEYEFNKDQERQIEDINVLTKRIENQLKRMRRAYQHEINIVEHISIEERDCIVRHNDKEWNDLHNHHSQLELTNMKHREDSQKIFHKDMSELRLYYEQTRRDIHMTLDLDIEDIQREYERIKTSVMINNEKLDYNLQILNNRSDENLLISSQQKRKLCKLVDVIEHLRRNIQKFDETIDQKTKKLVQENFKFHMAMLDMQKKSKHFARVNDTCFNEVWEMNQKQANKLIDRILSVDRILHEQHLGIDDWRLPAERLFGDKLLLPSYRRALKFIKKECSDEEDNVLADAKDATVIKFDDLNENYRRLIEQVMLLISNKSSFLIEDQLENILESQADQQKNLIWLDNVFSALEINDKAEIDMMMDFFRPYTFCMVCSTNDEAFVNQFPLLKHPINENEDSDNNNIISTRNFSTDKVVRGIGTTGDENSLIISSAICVMGDNNSRMSVLSDTPLKLHEKQSGESGGPSEIILEENFKKFEQPTAPNIRDPIFEAKRQCKSAHPLLISPVYVLRALREFMNSHKKVLADHTISEQMTPEYYTICRLVSISDIITFWDGYKCYFPKDNEHLWDTLLQGLHKYHDLLSDRKSTHADLLGLRKQNIELKKILMHCLKSTSNNKKSLRFKQIDN